MHHPLAYFFLAALSKDGAQAAPMAAIDQRIWDSCTDLNCRTIWNIVWSCLVTISLCTWVAGHPNIPGPKHGKIVVGLLRAWLAMDSLLTPELIIAWAIQQWLVARKSVRDVNGVFIFSYEL